MTTTYTKKQHYVPQFHLKNFSVDGERIYIYDKAGGSTGTIRYQTTIEIAHQNNFYTHRVKRGGKEDLEELFGLVESNAAESIRNVYSNKTITEKEKTDIALFASFQYARTPAYKSALEESVQKMGEAISRKMMTVAPKEMLKNFFAERGQIMTDAEIEDLKDFGTNPKRSQIVMETPTEYWIKLMLDFAPKIADIFLHMDWAFGFSDKKFAFITSDNPLVVIPPAETYKVGLVLPDTRKVVPLMSDMCLELGDVREQPRVSFYWVNKDYYRQINRIMMASAERFTFAANLGKLERLVKDVKPYQIKRHARVMVSG